MNSTGVIDGNNRTQLLNTIYNYESNFEIYVGFP